MLTKIPVAMLFFYRSVRVEEFTSMQEAKYTQVSGHHFFLTSKDRCKNEIGICLLLWVTFLLIIL